MKTGRLLKFPRRDGDLHAYLYQDGSTVRATVYRLATGHERTPVREVTGSSPEEVEAEVRAWIDEHFPPPA